MPVPTDKLFKLHKLHWWFVISSLFLTGSIIWLIWVDYDRPWRQIQNDYFVNKAALAHLEYLDASRPGQVDGQRRDQALAQDRQYRGAITDSGWLGRLPLVRSIINFPLFDFIAPRNTPGRHQINQVVLRGVRQRLNYLETPTIERCTTCHIAVDDPSLTRANLAEALEKALPAVNEELQRLGRRRVGFPAPPGVVRQDGAELDVGHVTDHWDWLTADQQDSYLDTLLKAVNDYLEAAGRDLIRFEPLLVAHPKPELYVSRESAHPLASMGCTACHEGNPPETDFVLAAHTPPDPDVAAEWADRYYVRRLGIPTATFDSVFAQWDRPMLPRQYTQAGCAACHHRVADLSRFGATGGGSVSDRGRHLFISLGCVNCHDIDTIPEARPVGPDLTRIASKLTPQFVHKWIHTPQKFRPSTRMPHFFDQENNRAASADDLDPDPELRGHTEVAAITEYLFAVSDEATLLGVPDDLTGNVSWGRELFKTLGCLACHASIAEFGESWIGRDLVRREGLDRAAAGETFRSMSYEKRVHYAMRHFAGELDAITGATEVERPGGRGDRPPIFTRFAPELSGVGSKTTFEWLYSWLMDPPRYAPDTKMPGLRLAPVEAAHIAAYLATLKNDTFDREDLPIRDAQRRMADQLLTKLLSSQLSPRQTRSILEDQGGQLGEMLIARLQDSLGEDRARSLITSMPLEQKRMTLLGSKMISHYGCYGCHRIHGFEQTPRPGTELSRWAEKPIARLDFAFFAPAHEGLRKEHPELFEHVYPPDAPELIERAHGRNPAARVAPTRASYARHHLFNPRIWDRMRERGPYEKLRMGNFYLSDDEVDALVTFLLSRQDPRVVGELRVDYRDTPAGMIADGRDLVRERNCVACHEIDGNAALIQQYFALPIGEARSFDDAPPPLRGEGAKVQSLWFDGFLNEFEPIRPWLTVRMPSFHLDEDQRTRLAKYFVGLSRDESQWVARRLAQAQEYIETERARAAERERPTRPQSSDASLSESAPVDKAGSAIVGGASSAGTAWYLQDSLADVTRELQDYAIENRFILPRALESANQGSVAYAQAHDKILTGAEKLRHLYDVDYPVVDLEPPGISAEQIADGETMFLAINCLSCHVFEDPQTPGAPEARLAPNLRPVHRRFRRQWMHLWLERPRRMVPHTYMPDFFRDDLTSPFTLWAPEERERLEELLHDRQIINDANEVIEAMTNFLFDAGARARTDIKFGSPLSR